MLTIDYNTFIIFVPKSYTQFVSVNPNTGLETRQINLTTFAQDVADLQDDVEGMWAPTAFQYTAPVNVGGVQLAPVVVVLSPYTVEFEDAQYAVQLNGANTNLQDETIVNQVSIRPNNSAGLTFSDAVNAQSFEGAQIWIDTAEGQVGTQFPRGTPADEVSNIVDAVTIAQRQGFHDFHLRGTLPLSGILAISRFQFRANTPADGVIIADNLEVEGCGFERISILGSITGRGSYKECAIGDTLNITGVEGIFDNCGIAGHLTLDAAATEPIIFKDCISTLAGLTQPSLNCNGTAAGINFRRYSGGLNITNFNNPAGTMTLDVTAGEVSIDTATCTNGIIVIRGVGRIVDENGIELPAGNNVINGNLTLQNFIVNRQLLDAMNLKLTEMHQMDGLDTANPVSITPTQKTSGTIDITIGGDGENIATLTRQ